MPKHNITEGKFVGLFNSLGFKNAKKEVRNLVVFTNNGIKCEVKPTRYTFGWLRNTDELTVIRQELINLGCKFDKDDGKCINVKFPDKGTLETFQYYVERLNSLESIRPRDRWIATKVFSPEVAETEIFLKIAKRYKHAIDEKDQKLLDVTRAVLEGDGIDHILTIGSSTKRTTNDSYREHIVPCIMIHNELIRLYLNGATLSEMAQFLKTNLAIVLISKKEADKIDNELGLRTTMPEGWKWGDSVFARLNAGNITVL